MFQGGSPIGLWQWKQPIALWHLKGRQLFCCMKLYVSLALLLGSSNAGIQRDQVCRDTTWLQSQTGASQVVLEKPEFKSLLKHECSLGDLEPATIIYIKLPHKSVGVMGMGKPMHTALNVLGAWWANSFAWLDLLVSCCKEIVEGCQ